jgi:hypothetical protein
MAVSDNPEYRMFELPAISLEKLDKGMFISRLCFVKQVVLGKL